MEIFPTIDSFCVLDLKRVIYEVFCHVIQGDLRQEDALSLLSDVTVRITLIFSNLIIYSFSVQASWRTCKLISFSFRFVIVWINLRFTLYSHFYFYNLSWFMM